MKSFWLVLLLFTGVRSLSAQTNPPPVRLALISETPEAGGAVDILTATLSGNENIQLLERDQIEKIYREQNLSAANRDYLKLGRVLGADGLVLVNFAKSENTTRIAIRLIAVKPGVILADGSFDWTPKDLSRWSEPATTYLKSFLPKLTVRPGEAIPLSVVNLRSAINSAGEAATEKQLKQLAIARLSEEPQFFVLERQKMQLLGDEKELKADDSAFWDGSYLLEGTIDQNGYSADTITLNARLTPPKEGVPILMEVSGSRTNLSDIINQLATKISEALKISSQVKPWNQADEARQFYNEATWALRWGVAPEAEAAADSAWALGKRDLDCATIRLKAYLAEETADTEYYQTATAYFSSQQGSQEESWIQADIRQNEAQHPWGLVFKEKLEDIQDSQHVNKEVDYQYLETPPDPKNIARAIHTLELYDAFSRTPTNGPSGAPSAIEEYYWHGPDWYALGLGDLTAASEILRNFNAVPTAQGPVADQLSTLRALTRTVAALISRLPIVRDSYFVGDRIATRDELSGAIKTSSNIFRCEVNWGCFWQERPEDAVLLYSNLMSSPVFCYIHADFWKRDLSRPRLVAWNPGDLKNIPAVWSGFTNDLANSTNLLLQMEAMALTWAEAADPKSAAAAYDKLNGLIKANREQLAANNVELFYLGWGLKYPYPLLDAMDQEYWNKTIPDRKTAADFEKQKQYLASLTPYDFNVFLNIFASTDYTKTQAAELRPLLAAYRSNLVAHAASQFQKFKAQSDGEFVEMYLGSKINDVLNPPAPPSPTPRQTQAAQPVAAVALTTPSPAPSKPQDAITNTLTVSKFLPIPLNELIQFYGLKNIMRSTAKVTAHHWLDGKLLLNFDYSFIDRDVGGADGSAIAILDPLTENWKIITCPKVGPMVKSPFADHTTLLNGELFNCDGGQIEKYDFADREWQPLGISDGNNYELFAVAGQLYLVNGSIISQAANHDQSAQLLASTRRQPPITALDTQLQGTPVLFEGLNHSLRVCTHDKIFTWTGNDWRQDCSIPSVSARQEAIPDGIHFSPGLEIFPDGIVFRQLGAVDGSFVNGNFYRQPDGSYGVLARQDKIFCLPNQNNNVKLYLKGGSDNWMIQRSGPVGSLEQESPSLWQMPVNLLPGIPAALRQSDLYLLANGFALHATVNDRHQIRQEAVADDVEYNAALFCFSPGFSHPLKVRLRFEPANQPPADWIFPTTNTLLCGNSVGVWTMPLPPLDAAIHALKQFQLTQQDSAAAALERAQKNLIAKYDLNHNGVVDPDEREAALDDPAFIASQLDVIDANHNGQLDLEELAYFDANQNKILESKEEAGINIARHLLAERDLEKFDANGDGSLNREEFFRLLSAENIQGYSPESFFLNVDENRDRKIDLPELESFLKQLLRRKLHPRGGPGSAFLMQQIQPGGLNGNARQLFKLEVEAYWRDPSSVTNVTHPTATHHGYPGGGFSPPGGMPPGTTP